MPYPPRTADDGLVSRLRRAWERLVAIADEGRDAFSALRSRLLLSCLLLALVSLAAVIVAELLWGHSDQWLYLSGMMLVLMAGTFDYARAGRYALYSQVLVGGLTLLALALIVASGGQSRAPQLSLPTLAMLAALLLSTRATLLWAALMLAGLLLSFYLRNSSAPVYIVLNPQWLESAIERFAAILIVVSVLVGIWSMGLVARLHERLRIDVADVEEAKRSRLQIETRLEQFVELASAWFWETDEQHRIVYLSAGFERVTGISPAAALGLTPAELMRIRYPNSPAADATMRPMIERRGFKDQLLSWHEPLTGTLNHYANSASPIHDKKGIFRGFRGRVIDVSARADSIRQVRESVQGDFLTGLMSRRGMLEALDHALIRLRDAEHHGWWIQIDLDQFHQLNSQLNYAQGDVFLKRFARSLDEMISKPNALARMDGDGFGILMLSGSRDDVQQVATRVLAIARGLRIEFLGAESGAGSASIGAVTISRATASVSNLLQSAEAACVKARDEGGARLLFAS